jgi:hypothetical protein
MHARWPATVDRGPIEYVAEIARNEHYSTQRSHAVAAIELAAEDDD